jgi:hypothetical protein
MLFWLIQWDAADRGFGIILYHLFAFTATAPMRMQETTLLFEHCFKFVVGIDGVGILFPEFQSVLEHRLLDFGKQVYNRVL